MLFVLKLCKHGFVRIYIYVPYRLYEFEKVCTLSRSGCPAHRNVKLACLGCDGISSQEQRMYRAGYGYVSGGKEIAVETFVHTFCQIYRLDLLHLDSGVKCDVLQL